MEVVQLLGLQEFWQHHVPGSWQVGQQEIQCSRRVWQPVLANTLQYSCLKNPRQRGLAGHSLQGLKESDTTKATLHAETKDVFACGSSAPGRVEHEGGTTAWLVGTLAAPSVQEHALPLPQELWPYQSLFSRLLSHFLNV